MLKFSLKILLFSAILLSGTPPGAQMTANSPPLDAYLPEDRAIAEGVLKNVTVETSRQISFPADSAVFHFLIDHPDFAATVSRELGLDKFQVQRNGAHYLISHGHDHGTFWVAERRPERVAYLATGTSKHPALRLLGIRLRARSYVLVVFGPRSPEHSEDEQTVRLQAFLQVENTILGPLFRWIAPFVRSTFEAKVTAAFRVAPQLSEMAYREGESFLEKVRRLPNLDKAQFAQFEDLVKAQGKRTLPSTGLDAKED